MYHNKIYQQVPQEIRREGEYL
jgi:glycine dehydrogenase